MHKIHGLAPRAMGLLTLLCFSTFVWAEDETIKPNQQPVIEFQEGRPNYGLVEDTVSDMAESSSLFVPRLIEASLVTGGLYMMSWRGLNAKIEHSLRNFEKTPQFIDEQIEIARLEKQAAQRITTLLQQAKYEQYQAVLERLPANAKSALLAEFQKKGITITPTSANGTAAIDDLVSALENYRGINLRQYEQWRKLGEHLETSLGAKPGTLTKVLTHPDQVLSECHALATKTVNPAAYDAELVRFEQALVREAQLKGITIGFAKGTPAAAGWLPEVSGLKWAKIPYTKRNWIPFFQVRNVLNNRSAMVFRNTMGRAFRISSFALIGVSIAIGHHMYDSALRDADRLSQLAREQRVATEIKDTELFAQNMGVDENALAIMVRAQWLDLEARLKAKGLDLPCPFEVDDEKSKIIIASAHAQALVALTESSSSTSAPVDSRSVAFYEVFWKEILEKAKSLPGMETLSEIPEDADLRMLELYGSARPPITLKEMLSDLSTGAPVAFQRVDQAMTSFNELEKTLAELDAEKQAEFLKNAKKASPELAAFFEMILVQKKALKEAAQSEDENPLKPDTEETAPTTPESSGENNGTAVPPTDASGTP